MRFLRTSRLLHPEPAIELPGSSSSGKTSMVPGQEGGAGAPPVTFTDDSGVLHTLTQEEAAARLKQMGEFERMQEKEKGADEKFREAAEIRKQATGVLEEYQQIKKDLEGFKTDGGAFSRVTKTLGISEGDAKILWGLSTGETDLNELVGTAPDDDNNQPTQLHMHNLPAPVRGFFAACEKEGLDPAQVVKLSAGLVNKHGEDHTKEEVEKAVASDPILGKMIVGKPGNVVDAFHSRVFTDVKRRVESGDAWSPELIRDEARNVANFLDSIGANQGQPQQSERAQALASITGGVGPVPGSFPAGQPQPEKRPMFDLNKVGNKGSVADFADRLISHEVDDEEREATAF